MKNILTIFALSCHIYQYAHCMVGGDVFGAVVNVFYMFALNLYTPNIYLKIWITIVCKLTVVM